MNVVGDIRSGLATAHKDWGWFMALGISLIVLGVLAIIYESQATYASITALGIIIVIAGIVQIVALFQSRNAGHIILYLLFGALELFVGFSLIRYPLAGTLTVTLVLAVYLIFVGIFRFVYALWAQFPQYGWAAFSGVVSFILGVLLWMQWPYSALWFIGFAVGLSFIFAGIAWAGFSLKLKALPA
jgi:uncharacterized membrane protein HdeD (DUF308 family)